MANVKTVKKSFGNMTLVFTCEECEGQYLDTKVTINGETLCWVSFPEIDTFVEKLDNTMSDHRI